jgi:two-component system, NarL family, sensor kinase
MFQSDEEIYITVIASACLMIALVIVVVVAILKYQNRVKKHILEMITLKATYEQEILRSQVEIQNQTLKYVGEELHDNIQQMLLVVKLYLSMLERDLNTPETQQQAQEITELVNQTMSELRAMSKSLDSDAVKDFGLEQSLAYELQRIRKSRRYETELRITGERYSLGYQQEIVLFRVVQEIVSNALKHAGAKHLSVRLDYQPQRFHLTVADNGKGFDYEQVTQQDIDGTGAGLRNIRRRTELIGGTCTYQSTIGQGTTVLIELKAPLPPEGE